MARELPQVTFEILVSTFATQAAVSLGRIPNPTTQKTEEDLLQAKFAIDLLQLLQEKTKGNLTEEESKFLDDCLYQFRMVYINKTADKE